MMWCGGGKCACGLVRLDLDLVIGSGLDGDDGEEVVGVVLLKVISVFYK